MKYRPYIWMDAEDANAHVLDYRQIEVRRQDADYLRSLQGASQYYAQSLHSPLLMMAQDYNTSPLLTEYQRRYARTSFWSSVVHGAASAYPWL